MSVTDPYSLSPPDGAAEMTLFQILFPTQGADAARVAMREVVPVKTRSDSLPERVAGVLAVPSSSASERIRAWETAPGTPTARLLSDPESSESECCHDPSCRHTADAPSLSREYAAEGSRVQHPGAAAQDHSTCADGDTSRVPFAKRVREVERRFREQMEVHRGLAAASRQLDVLEHSVHMFQAERRTRAFARTLAERQDAIWARVWPASSFPTVENAAAIGHRQAGASAPVVPIPATRGGETPAVKPAVRPGDSSATPSTSSAPSPWPQGSPTGALLKDIITAYSKSRELRGTSSGSSSSAAVAPPPPPLSKPRKGAPLPPARVSQRTATGLQIVRPEEAPKPYTLIRYVKARSEQVSATHSTADRQGSLASPTGASAATTAVSADFPEAIRAVEDYSRELSTVEEEDHQAHQEGAGEVSDESSGSVTDAAASIDDTYDTNTFDSHVSYESAAGSSVSSSESSIASPSIPTEDATSPPLTYTTVSEDAESAAVGCRSRDSLRFEGKRSGAPVAEDPRAAPFAEVLHAFFDACRCVSAASAQLLQSPYIREKSHTARQRRKHASLPATKCAASSALTSEKDASEAGEETRDFVSSLGAHAATGAGVSHAAWCEDLYRQLRNVRRLQRFRGHLLRHLKRVDVQEQTRRKATRLLREAQILAKARRKLLSGAIVPDDPSLEGMLRDMEGVSKGGREERRLRRGGSGHGKGKPWPPYPSSPRHPARSLSDQDTITEVLFTDTNSDISDGVASADSDVVEEELPYGSHQSGSVVSDSIVEEEVDRWEDASGYSEAASGGAVSSAVSKRRGGDGEPSYGSDSFEAASHADTVGGSAWVGCSGAMAQGGLEAIEEELAERLAELPPDAISDGRRIPSDVDELVDLLPSSLIPSETDGGAASLQSSSADTLISSVVTDRSSSAAALQVQQRRLYVGAKGLAERYAAAGEAAAGVRSGATTDHTAYICDAPTSGVYSVPEDADVDTSVRQSTDVCPEGPLDSLSRTSGGVSDLDKAVPDGMANTRRSRRSSTTPSAPRDGGSGSSSSSSEDALAGLEADLSLTKERRRQALRSASDVPTFEQLYNPLVQRLREEGAPSSGDHTSSCHGSSRSPTPSRREGEPGHRVDVVGSGAVVSAHHERGAEDIAPHPTPRTEVGTQAEMHVVARHPAATLGASQIRVTYPVEDYVAQSAWKARQLHILQQLRSPIAADLGSAPESSVEASGNPRHDRQRRHQPPKDEAEAALDAAESAAREEWAQHWGIVEALLQTRFFASSRGDAIEPLQAPAHSGNVLPCFAPLNSAASSRDASQSNVPVSSASC
ncbi:hypothetical protein LSCM1_03513 [Leishmania martiniquensis]|uniref:Uncharacterized protein n=1 Tax=Leishmania martiniquensis TaxID=1580590 RepID=A0A836KLW8_9TRYP|nr:hypothetical protein LSCM1_03513 [Leishmania martiniquensis]